MCMVSDRNETKIEKVMVSDLEIVVLGTISRPYYIIRYYDLSDNQYHVGYGSHNLDYVFQWKEECFEVVSNKEKQDEMYHQIKILRNLSACQKSINDKRMLLRVANTIEELYARSSGTTFCDKNNEP